jgi:hypothetical protein
MWIGQTFFVNSKVKLLTFTSEGSLKKPRFYLLAMSTTCDVMVCWVMVELNAFSQLVF